MAQFNRQASRKIKKQRSKNLFGSLQRPRVVISKSNRYLTVQAIDDVNQVTLAYLCSSELRSENSSKESKLRTSFKSEEFAGKLGVEFAEKLNEQNITNIVFDRNGYVYHGKVKIFCEKMRGSGINF